MKEWMRTFEFVDDEERLQYQNAWYLLGIGKRRRFEQVGCN